MREQLPINELLTPNGNTIKFGTAAPTTGTYKVGDIVINTTPVSGSAFAWSCSAAGTPGTWIEPPAMASVTATAAEINYLDIAVLGTGAASKAVVVDASGNYTMPDGGFFGLSVAALAAAGNSQATYAAVADQVNAVTGADGTVGVALPAAVAGRAIYVINTSQTAVLPVAPVNAGNDQINALTAGTGVFTMGPARAAWFIPTSATQWYVTGDAAIVGTPTEQDMDGILATMTEVNRTCDVSTRLVAAGAALTVTVAAHDGKTILLDTAGGSTCTLPVAAATGARVRFAVTTRPSGAAHIIKVGNASDFIAGQINLLDLDAAAQGAFQGDGAADDTITINNTTTGGAIGDYIELEDTKANVWTVVHGALTVPVGSNPADPFSATV